MASDKRVGFTIIELLVVVVVIAVLAAVAIVAFGAIRDRAENTRTTSAVGAYARALRTYAVLNGNYPVTGLATFVCLGSPAGGVCGNTTSSVVGACGGNSGPGVTNATFDIAIRTVLTSLPNPSPQTFTCNTRQFTGAHYYYEAAGTNAFIVYYLKGDQTCGGIGGLENFGKYAEPGVTACGAQLPVIP